MAITQLQVVDRAVDECQWVSDCFRRWWLLKFAACTFFRNNISATSHDGNYNYNPPTGILVAQQSTVLVWVIDEDAVFCKVIQSVLKWPVSRLESQNIKGELRGRLNMHAVAQPQCQLFQTSHRIKLSYSLCMYSHEGPRVCPCMKGCSHMLKQALSIYLPAMVVENVYSVHYWWLANLLKDI